MDISIAWIFFFCGVLCGYLWKQSFGAGSVVDGTEIWYYERILLFIVLLPGTVCLVFCCDPAVRALAALVVWMIAFVLPLRTST